MNRTTKKWHGSDASNQISLFEYGLLCRETKNGLQVIYKNDDKFSFGYFDPFYFWNDSFVDMDELCNFSGVETPDYINDKELFMYDLVSFYGTENVFGTDYSVGYSEAQIRKQLNKALTK